YGIVYEAVVECLAVFDDGSGPALYAGGHFTTAGGVLTNGIAKWDGAAWSALGDGLAISSHTSIGEATALAVFDDGNGSALYAGGLFDMAGGVPANFIAKWNGSDWSALGSGTNGAVYSLDVFDDAYGPALYAGGAFTTAGGTTANMIAKWVDATWSPL